MKDQKLIEYIKSIRNDPFMEKLVFRAGNVNGLGLFRNGRARSLNDGAWAHTWSDILQVASEVLTHHEGSSQVKE